MKKELSIHEFPGVLERHKINPAELGCVMLDVMQDKTFSAPDLDGEDYLYKSPDPKKFWIDGWVMNKAHITLLYGLLEPAQKYAVSIEEVLGMWKIEHVEIEEIGFFESPYPEEPYYCIVAHIRKTLELQEGHDRLTFLPHVNTFPGYKPHMTIAYIKKDAGIRDRLIKIMDGHYKFYPKVLVESGLNLGGSK